MKKALAIWLSFLLAVTCVPAWFVGAEDALVDEDAYQQQLFALSELGILEEGAQDSHTSDEVVSRGAFVRDVMATLGVELSGQVSPFSDVDDSHPYGPAIVTAYYMGIVSGFGDGTFLPDDAMTYDQAVSVLMKGMGYAGIIERSGGFPAGTFIAARRAGVLGGITAPEDGILLHGVATRLLYNALDAVMLTTSGVEGDTTTYTEETLLWATRRIKKARGMVTATRYTRLTQPEGVGEGNLEIDYVVYPCDGDYDSLIGRNVLYYIQEDGNEQTLVLVLDDTREGDTVNIPAEYIEGLSGNTLSYWPDGDKDADVEEVQLAGQLKVVENGRATGDFTVPYAGRVVLTSSGTGAGFDVAVVTNYETILVGSVDTENRRVVDKYDNTKLLSLDSQDTEYYRMQDLYGDDVTISDIQPYNVLMAAVSADGQIVDILVLTEEVQGTVDEIVSEGEGGKLVIGGDTYEIAAGCPVTTEVKLGDTGSFYLDNAGRIVGFQRDVNLEGYAFLVNLVNDNGMDRKLTAKMFTLEGEMVYRDVSEKLKVDGIQIEDNVIPASMLDGGEFMPQMVKYELNGSGILIKLDTVDKTSAETDDSLRSFGPKAKLRYYGATRTLNAQFFLSDNTKVLMVPTNPKFAEDDKFSTNSISYFMPSTDYTVQAFSTKADALMPDVVVVEIPDGNSEIENPSPIFCVTKWVEAVNADGEPRTKLEGYSQTGAESDLFVENDDLLQEIDLHPGDIIKYATNISGEVVKMVKAYDSVTGTIHPDYAVQADYGNIFRIVAKYVLQKDGTMVALSTTAPGAGVTPDEYANLEQSQVVVLSDGPDGLRARKGSVSDIRAYQDFGDVASKIFIYFTNTVPKLVVVYDNIQ